MGNTTKKIEDQLVDTESEPLDVYLSLDSADDDTTYLGVEDDDIFGRDKVNQVLTGAKAAQFLGLPVRPHNILHRGDHSRIQIKFESLLKRLVRSGANEDLSFWDHISIKVWNKKNLESLNKNEIKGKKTAGCTSLGIPPAEYSGDLFKGSAISNFLSETKNSNKFRQYLIQLESVNVTEEMAHA